MNIKLLLLLIISSFFTITFIFIDEISCKTILKTPYDKLLTSFHLIFIFIVPLYGSIKAYRITKIDNKNLDGDSIRKFKETINELSEIKQVLIVSMFFLLLFMILLLSQDGLNYLVNAPKTDCEKYHPLSLQEILFSIFLTSSILSLYSGIILLKELLSSSFYFHSIDRCFNISLKETGLEQKKFLYVALTRYNILYAQKTGTRITNIDQIYDEIKCLLEDDHKKSSVKEEYENIKSDNSIIFYNLIRKLDIEIKSTGSKLHQYGVSVIIISYILPQLSAWISILQFMSPK